MEEPKKDFLLVPKVQETNFEQSSSQIEKIINDIQATAREQEVRLAESQKRTEIIKKLSASKDSTLKLKIEEAKECHEDAIRLHSKHIDSLNKLQSAISESSRKVCIVDTIGLCD